MRRNTSFHGPPGSVEGVGSHPGGRSQDSRPSGLLMTLKLVLKCAQVYACVYAVSHTQGTMSPTTVTEHKPISSQSWPSISGCAPNQTLPQGGTGNVTIPRAFLPATQERFSPWFPQKQVGSILSLLSYGGGHWVPETWRCYQVWMKKLG